MKIPALFKSQLFWISLAAGIILTGLTTFIISATARETLKYYVPYTFVFAFIISFPIIAFRFFDPHENFKPIALYFILTGLDFALFSAPDVVAFFGILIQKQALFSALVRRLLLGIIAFISIGGISHFLGSAFLSQPSDSDKGWLTLHPGKFLIYALAHLIYLNLFIEIARGLFGRGINS